jgi:hypothetical protein
MILTKPQHHNLSQLLRHYFPPNLTLQPIPEDRHRQEDTNEENSEPDDQPPATGHNAKRRKLHRSAPETTTPE